MNKTIVISDNNRSFDQANIHSRMSNMYDGNGIKGTDVLICDGATGKPLYRKSNKVIIPGSAFTAGKHFGIDPVVTLPSYNSAMALDNSVTTPPENSHVITLFAVGTDGAGAEASQILDVDYTKWCDPSNLVPFRYVPKVADLDIDERQIYFGKKTLENYYAYYFKAFEADPIMYMQYTDGTPITSNIYGTNSSLPAETVVELNLRITKEDCREFFAATSSLAYARINTIELLAAWYKEIEGVKYFQNIQPITKLNINSESLTDETKALDVVYHIYY